MNAFAVTFDQFNSALLTPNIWVAVQMSNF